VSIRVTASTMGVSTPATLAEDAGGTYYKYRGDSRWTPNDARYRLPDKPHPQNTRTSTERAGRLAEYGRLRLEGTSSEAAAERLGLARSTRGQYEREFQAQQRGGDRG
jgi:hypothetical protein